MLTNQPVLYQVNLKRCLLALCSMHSEVKRWASSASVWCHYGSGRWFDIYVAETWQKGCRGWVDIYSTQHLSLSQRWQLECVCLQTQPEIFSPWETVSSGANWHSITWSMSRKSRNQQSSASSQRGFSIICCIGTKLSTIDRNHWTFSDCAYNYTYWLQYLLQQKTLQSECIVLITWTTSN